MAGGGHTITHPIFQPYEVRCSICNGTLILHFLSNWFLLTLLWEKLCTVLVEVPSLNFDKMRQQNASGDRGGGAEEGARVNPHMANWIVLKVDNYLSMFPDSAMATDGQQYDLYAGSQVYPKAIR